MCKKVSIINNIYIYILLEIYRMEERVINAQVCN